MAKKRNTQTAEDIAARQRSQQHTARVASSGGDEWSTVGGRGWSTMGTGQLGGYRTHTPGGTILAPRGETTSTSTGGGYGTPPTSAALPSDVGTGALAEPQPTGTEGSYQAITDMFQQAMDEANAANEARYQQGMGIYQNIADMFGPGSTYGAGQTAMLEQQKTQDVAKAQQHMAGSGLWNTTVAAAIPQAWEANVGMPGRLNIEDMRMGRYAGALEGMAGFVERRTDQGPDMGLFANLMAGASQGPGGYGSTATPSYGASTTQTGGAVSRPIPGGSGGSYTTYAGGGGAGGSGGGAGGVGFSPMAQETFDRGQADRAQQQQLQAAGGVIGPGSTLGGSVRSQAGAMQSLGRQGGTLGTATQQSYGNYAVAGRAPTAQVAQDTIHYGAGSSRRR